MPGVLYADGEARNKGERPVCRSFCRGVNSKPGEMARRLPRFPIIRGNGARPFLWLVRKERTSVPGPCVGNDPGTCKGGVHG